MTTTRIQQLKNLSVAAPLGGAIAAVALLAGATYLAIAIAVTIAIAAVWTLFVPQLLTTPWQKGLMAVGIAALLLGSVLATPPLAHGEDYVAPHAHVDMRVWEDAESGDRWAEIVPLTAFMRDELGGQDSVVVGWSETLNRVDINGTVPDRPALHEVPVDISLVNRVVEDHITGTYLSSTAPESTCFIPCFSLRQESTTWTSIYNQEMARGLTTEQSAGLMAVGGTMVGFAARAGVVTYTTGAAGATTSLIGFSAALGPIGWGVIIVGALIVAAGAYAFHQAKADNALEKANAWAENPANGCATCGLTSATFQWYVDTANDACRNPACDGDEGEDPSDSEDAGDSGSGSGGGMSDGTTDGTTDAPPGPNDNHGGGSGGTLGGSWNGPTTTDPCPGGAIVEGEGEGCAEFAACDEMPFVPSSMECSACVEGGEVIWSTCNGELPPPPPETQQPQ